MSQFHTIIFDLPYFFVSQIFVLFQNKVKLQQKQKLIITAMDIPGLVQRTQIQQLTGNS